MKNRTGLGSDIFIHGNAVTIGCIPVGDKAIEELFTLVSLVGIEKTEVIIAPLGLRVNQTPTHSAEWVNQKYKNLHHHIIKFVHHKKMNQTLITKL